MGGKATITAHTEQCTVIIGGLNLASILIYYWIMCNFYILYLATRGRPFFKPIGALCSFWRAQWAESGNTPYVGSEMAANGWSRALKIGCQPRGVKAARAAIRSRDKSRDQAMRVAPRQSTSTRESKSFARYIVTCSRFIRGWIVYRFLSTHRSADESCTCLSFIIMAFNIQAQSNNDRT